MSNINESTVTPNSIEAQAIAELQKEGHEINTGKPDVNDGEIKDSPVPPKEVTPEVPKTLEKVVENTPPVRTPTMVETWKLKVAEDQKAGLEKELIDLKKQVEDLSKQKGPVTIDQKSDVTDEIKRIAEETGADATTLTRLADVILKKADSNRPADDSLKTVRALQEKIELTEQLNQYSDEFVKDVIPLVKEYNLSDQALSDLKSTLKDFAFSETYAKVPLKDIFKIKADGLDLRAPKKSSESKGVKARATDLVDIDSLDEDSFSKLSPEQVEKFAKAKTEGGWNSNKK